MLGIVKGYLGQTEFKQRPGQPIDPTLTVEQLSDLWLFYADRDDLEACDRIVEVLLRIEQSLSHSSPINMGLSAVTNSHKSCPKRISATRSKRGSKGITPNGKRTVKSAVKLMEQTYGIDRLFLGTNTLPPLSEAELTTVCRDWSSITKNFKTDLQRHLRATGQPDDCVIVTEIQEKRYAKTGQVYPHLHYVIVNRSHAGAKWSIQRSDLNQIWQTVLSNKLNRPVPVMAACQLDPCRKSAANEVGKYLSKGGKVLSRIKADGKSQFLPKNWYNVSANLREKVKNEIETFNGKAVELFFDNLSLLKTHGFIEFRMIYREVLADVSRSEKQTICVGASSFIRDEFIKDFRKLLSNEREMEVLIGLLSQKFLKTA